MTRKTVVVAGVALLGATLVQAESVRTQYAVENKWPGANNREVGADGFIYNFEASDEYVLTPYIRYGATDYFTLLASVPFMQIERDFGGESSGIGDAGIGFELLVYQDIFDYPFLIPHGEFRFPTGDEDEDLGNGDPSGEIGITLGSVMYEQVTLMFDGGLLLNESSTDPSDDNESRPYGGGSIVWDLNKQFAFLAEARVMEVDGEHPVFYHGGMSFKPTKDLVITYYAGSADQSDLDFYSGLKLAYTF